MATNSLSFHRSAAAPTLRVELHAHTWWSGDCGVRPLDLCKAARDAGLGAIAVTDHNQIDGAYAAADCGIIPVIIGEEIRTAEGELLAYFLTDWIPPGLSPRETISRIREQGGIISIPHPFDRARNSTMAQHLLPELAGQLDMIEVFNSRVIDRSHNEKAMRLCQDHGRIAAVGSDAHTRGEVGASWQEIDEFAGPDQFLRAMTGARLNTQISSPLVRLASNWQKVRKRTFGPDVAGLRRP